MTRRLAYPLLLPLLAAVFAVVTLRLYTSVRYQGRIASIEGAPAAPVAIVFGAGLRPDGSASTVLHDRVATAAALFHEGKAERLLMSGDGRESSHDEPGAMRDLAMRLGVPDAAILLDPKGIRTAETCTRAAEVFGVRAALLVTQAFHLPRALMTCEALGIDAAGVRADQRAYPIRYVASWHARESLATAVAWWEIKGPRGEPPPIPRPLEASR